MDDHCYTHMLHGAGIFTKTGSHLGGKCWIMSFDHGISPGTRLIEGFLGLSTSQSKSIEYGLKSADGGRSTSGKSKVQNSNYQWENVMLNDQ